MNASKHLPLSPPRLRYFVGLRGKDRIVFSCMGHPTEETHGAVYPAVVGPFKTYRGARFMARYGVNNPHCRCVNDAERLAKHYASQQWQERNRIVAAGKGA